MHKAPVGNFMHGFLSPSAILSYPTIPYRCTDSKVCLQFNQINCLTFEVATIPFDRSYSDPERE